jgi:tartrate-resistant acid phosphatase type 5
MKEGNAATMSSGSIDRRRFLRQSFAYSALASLGPLSGSAAVTSFDSRAANLLMVGDWGIDNEHSSGDHSAQIQVATGMRQYAQRLDFRTEALLMLGDNWYGELEGGARSSRWQKQFEQMYPAEIFSCSAYAVLGNHDYQCLPESKVDAELDYARLGKSRWTMPARWYRFEFPKKNPLVTFLALDSNMPNANAHEPDFTLTVEQKSEQLKWLERQLRHPRTTPFLAVMAHHPVYSDGPHGDHKTLIHDWDPLFRKHKVDFYLAGHDHDLQHLEFEGHPTSFFMSGGGGAALYDFTVDPLQRGPYGQKVYGFSHLSVTSEEVTLRHLNHDGQVIYAFTKTVAGKITIQT